MARKADFKIKSLTPASDWFAVVVASKGVADLQRVIAWVVFEEPDDQEDEICAAVNQNGTGEQSGISYVGDFYPDLAGYIHVSEIDQVPKRFGLKLDEHGITPPPPKIL
jgi:hypothetical protein